MSVKPLATLKALSLFLRYPEREWIAETDALLGALRREGRLPAPVMREMEALAGRLAQGDLLESQESYGALFDRSRPLALHLFEHVHGESRDRGQAMVDLAQLYRDHGLEPVADELPDYLPLFLEFLSTLPETEALATLRDAAPILTALAQRLVDRDSDYAAPFRALQALLGLPLSVKNPDVRPLPVPDLDAVWAEPSVQFLDNASPQQACPATCGGCTAA